MDQIDIAVHQTAHDAKGGMAALARAMGKGHQVLINKCNPNSENSALSLREAVAMMAITEDYRILEVVADQLGFNIVKKELGPVMSIISAVLSADAEQGDVGRAIKDALSDGKLTQSERARISQEIAEAKHALDELNHSIQSAQTRIGQA